LLGSPFDPRAGFLLDEPRLAQWRADRMAWLRERFGDDPRLLCATAPVSIATDLGSNLDDVA
jgi:hypothetical protein